MTQEKLAFLVGQSTNGFMKSIKTNKITVENLEKVAQVLRVPVVKIFEENFEAGNLSVTQSVKQSRNVRQTAQMGSDALMEIIREKDRQIERLLEMEKEKKSPKNKSKNKPSKTKK
jgi:transcriptional regulator with XRE-family HTH domain